MSDVLQQARDAMNAHDAERFAALFADDYQSAQPVHPNRAFHGRAQVLENWTSVFEGVPDFEATLLSSSITGEDHWSEWDWHGHHTDGTAFAMRGVTIMVVRDGLIAAARLYVEPVEEVGDDISATVQDLYRPPPAAPE